MSGFLQRIVERGATTIGELRTAMARPRAPEPPLELESEASSPVAEPVPTPAKALETPLHPRHASTPEPVAHQPTPRAFEPTNVTPPPSRTPAVPQVRTASAPLRSAGVRSTQTVPPKGAPARNAREATPAAEALSSPQNQAGPSPEKIEQWRALAQRLLVSHPPAAPRPSEVAQPLAPGVAASERTQAPAPTPAVRAEPSIVTKTVVVPEPKSPVPRRAAVANLRPHAESATSKARDGVLKEAGALHAPNNTKSPLMPPRRELLIRNLEVTVALPEPQRPKAAPALQTSTPRTAPASAPSGAWTVAARNYLGRI